MNIDRLEVQLVAREPAEAQDLGLQLLRRHAGATFGAVLVAIVPVWALALFVGSASMWGGLLAIWWTKPLINRVAIHVLSRAVFGAAPTVLQTISALPSMIDRPLIALLTWRRLDIRRSLWFPTACLEGLRGSDLRERYGAIKYGQVEREATVSTITFLHIEMALAFAGFFLVVWMLPEGLLPDFWWYLIGAVPEAGSSYQWVSIGAWLPGLLLCEVAYTAAGFGMYLSRRTELEGWNVELAFQRMGARLTAAARRGVAILLPLMVAAAALFGTADGAALGQVGEAHVEGAQVEETQVEAGSESLTKPSEIAQDVLNHSDFDTTTERTTWVPAFDMDDSPLEGSVLLRLLAQVLKGVGWVLVGGVLIALVVYIARRLESGGAVAIKKAAPKPLEAFGLDLRKESLPADIAAAAKALVSQGAIVPGLSLLYRGALHRLVEDDELEIFPGDTEHDCMRRVRDAAAAGAGTGAVAVAGAAPVNGTPLADYFGSLTSRWLSAAWGASPPQAADALALCDGWAAHFGSQGERGRGGKR